MMSRTTMAVLSALGGALLITACDSATAPVSNLRPPGSASADRGSGDADDACKDGGFANYTRTDGSTFKNQGDCVSYVAQGGQLSPKTPPPSISSFSVAGPVLKATFDGGTGMVTDPAGTITPVTSNQVLSVPIAEGTWTLTVTNAAGSVSSSFFCDYWCAWGGFNNRKPGGKGRIGAG
jgi:hypothetical protein